MILTIDAGNTRIKGAVFEQHTLVDTFLFETETLQEKILKILNENGNITDIVIASVGKAAFEEFLIFSERVNVRTISHQDVFPFKNLYETPLTLGIDRMVLAAGAVLAYPGDNRLVIDAGTCITYDFVNDQDEYLGGAISPGIRLRYKGLHQFTAKLPLLERQDPENFIGKSTNEAIHSGVINGVLHEIDGFIAQYQAQCPKFTIILTGGDAEFLAKQLKNTIFANSNFLLESLNHIFHYTNQND
ncbi:MAG: pantothenate kinase [Flavobacterium sp. BFFFF1]|uniref:type III pantothenate kinase n=1 Tax=Flavobacterium sp. BFFFF1 TaxID=2015557 RepID=UPI000BD99F16|nr:type III pantothenate kinase [Flavobacterium sp. BFFFF1]OYU82178.1 MAG: pantothenate kinase [Flavobacterium sp. BFFFF1]